MWLSINKFQTCCKAYWLWFNHLNSSVTVQFTRSLLVNPIGHKSTEWHHLVTLWFHSLRWAWTTWLFFISWASETKRSAACGVFSNSICFLPAFRWQRSFWASLESPSLYTLWTPTSRLLTPSLCIPTRDVRMWRWARHTHIQSDPLHNGTQTQFKSDVSDSFAPESQTSITRSA